ncbi:hypothetical protein PIB30_038616 [Stylosanthes scabra]|uniref:LOB domain-containing protein n=1 Tax=Stylosanthes scabra TaxID=79078 RepID=A0ABU6SFC6_9FABA|nr:hypothetical protein [Stylosanthes scabra]
MSCNGCRVLRKGCSEECMLRHCLMWIEDNPEAQGYATLFVAKFFGRANLMSFLSSVPTNHRSALFQSLLYEAVGRTINPVDGAVGLLSTGNWHLCQLAVDKVLRGGAAALMMDTGHHHQVVMKRKQVSFEDYFLKEAESQDRNGGGHHHHHQSKKQRACSPPTSNEESNTTTLTTTTHHSPSQTQTKPLTLFF